MNAFSLNNVLLQLTKKAPVFFINQWCIQQGDCVFLYGESGSGKSTFLNLLSTVIAAQAGDVQILQKDIAQMSANEVNKFRAQHIGYVFQQFNLVPYLSVQENLSLAARFQKKPIDKLHLATMLEKLSLPTAILKQRTDALSVGQAQRVAIIRALIHQPEILICDEPTSALDYQARDEFMQLLLTTCQENNTTLVFVSHDLSLKKFFEYNTHIQEIMTRKD